jgi:hypothetical protein
MHCIGCSFTISNFLSQSNYKYELLAGLLHFFNVNEYEHVASGGQRIKCLPPAQREQLLLPFFEVPTPDDSSQPLNPIDGSLAFPEKWVIINQWIERADLIRQNREADLLASFQTKTLFRVDVEIQPQRITNDCHLHTGFGTGYRQLFPYNARFAGTLFRSFITLCGLVPSCYPEKDHYKITDEVAAFLGRIICDVRDGVDNVLTEPRFRMALEYEADQQVLRKITRRFKAVREAVGQEEFAACVAESSRDAQLKEYWIQQLQRVQPVEYFDFDCQPALKQGVLVNADCLLPSTYEPSILPEGTTNFSLVLMDPPYGLNVHARPSAVSLGGIDF